MLHFISLAMTQYVVRVLFSSGKTEGSSFEYICIYSHSRSCLSSPKGILFLYFAFNFVINLLATIFFGQKQVTTGCHLFI